MAVALDSGVVIGFLDSGDPHHQAAVGAVRSALSDGNLVVSAVVYAEVMAGARIGHHPEGAIAGFFAELVSEISVLDVATADRAATIRASHAALRLPDALIAASAQLHPNVEVLLTTDSDLSNARVSGCEIARVN